MDELGMLYRRNPIELLKRTSFWCKTDLRLWLVLDSAGCISDDHTRTRMRRFSDVILWMFLSWNDFFWTLLGRNVMDEVLTLLVLKSFWIRLTYLARWIDAVRLKVFSGRDSDVKQTHFLDSTGVCWMLFWRSPWRLICRMLSGQEIDGKVWRIFLFYDVVRTITVRSQSQVRRFDAIMTNSVHICRPKRPSGHFRKKRPRYFFNRYS